MGDVILSDVLEHGIGDGRHGGAHHRVGQNRRESRREQKPKDDLPAVIAAHQTHKHSGDAPVQAGLLPGDGDDGGAQQQQNGL